jgi:hypothetical protein
MVPHVPHGARRTIALACAAALAGGAVATPARAQRIADTMPVAPRAAPASAPASAPPLSLDLPEKSVLIPAVEILTFDLLLSNYNRQFSGTAGYDVNGHTIGANLRGPWVTDSDPFKINQFAHPYQGSLYHGAARSMGLSYWEASALTFAGSVWWEIAGEKTPPSYNDQIASGISGSFLGEPLFRMAPLVRDHSSLPPAWRPWAAGAISPPVAINHRLFGDGYGGVFDDHDPEVYARLRLGGTHVTVGEFNGGTRGHDNAAVVDFSMDYGLPGRTGYTYRRPFDQFQFQTTVSSANGLELLTSTGLLWGEGWSAGDDVRGVWGLYGTYEYLSPQVYHVSTTALSAGATTQWQPLKEIAVQGRLMLGYGYAAASSTTRDVNSAEYHYGVAPRAALGLRLIDDRRVSLDLGARTVALGSTASRSAGRDTISRVESAVTWRVFGHHAIGIDYVWSHRSASFPTAPQRVQTLGTVGVFYTLLGQDDFGAVEWHGDPK